MNQPKIDPILAIIPARGGSKGLPGKNIIPFVGHPLIAHAIMFAQSCPEIDRYVVTTDSEEIAAAANEYGADVINRPKSLARDNTPMWPVLKHALLEAEEMDGKRYQSVLLLDPTSPSRLIEDVHSMKIKLSQHPDSDGIISVSQPEFHPLWHCVVEKEGWMAELIPDASHYTRRQELPTVYRINGSLYLWRRNFLFETDNWRMGQLLIYEIPEHRTIHIDDIYELKKSELLVKNDFIKFPWLEGRS